MDRNQVIAEIKTALRKRSGRSWSVTGGRGTSWGWISIHAQPSQRVGYDYLSEQDQAALAQLLGLDSVHHQGISIPAGNDYYQEYLDRAHGRAPSKIGRPYWD